MVVKRIAPMSLAKLSLVVYALMGLIFGAMFSVFGMIAGGLAGAAGESGLPPMFGMMFGIGAIIFAPVFYGVIGFIGGLIGAVVFNLAAGWMGGLELDVQ